MKTNHIASSDAFLPRLRAWVLTLWAAGLVGIGIELLLLGHTEGFWQIAPLGLILCGLLALGWFALAPRRVAVRFFQIVLLLLIVVGVIGVVMHFRGKMAFKLETNPDLAGWKLFSETIKGIVPPILAPAALVHFGLLGLACTFRHPALATSTKTINLKDTT